jgi:hypothetical protein
MLQGLSNTPRVSAEVIEEGLLIRRQRPGGKEVRPFERALDACVAGRVAGEVDQMAD